MRVINPHTRQHLSRLRVCDVRALDCARVGTLSVPQLQSWYVHTDPVCRKQRTVETDRCNELWLWLVAIARRTDMEEDAYLLGARDPRLAFAFLHSGPRQFLPAHPPRPLL